MKRILLAMAFACAVTTAVVPPAGAQVLDSKGRDCTEMTGGFGSYALGATPTTRVVTTQIALLAAPCDQVTYTFTVSYSTLSGAAASVTTTAYEVVDGTNVKFAVDVPDADAPATVHGVVTTSKRGKVYDSTEADIVLDGVPGGGGGSYQG